VIKSAAVEALDNEYRGLISEFVELTEFAGKPVSVLSRLGDIRPHFIGDWEIDQGTQYIAEKS
jgi:hypothetical protein